MTRVISAPSSLLPKSVADDTLCFSQYSKPVNDGFGMFAQTLPTRIRRKGFIPDLVTWDFTTIALSVAAADNSIRRENNPDGWTREIALDIHVCEPLLWNGVAGKIERMLRFLTGDVWHLTFYGNGYSPDRKPLERTVHKYAEKYSRADCVALLSGGMDSLIGCIDIVHGDGLNPIFVSHTVNSNSEQQRIFANTIKKDAPSVQLNQDIHHPFGESETTTRGRSIVFFAFAALAACAIRRNGIEDVPVYVSENGFISLNVGLNPGRISSFSTKTTHPIYMRLLSEIWAEVGIRCKLILPDRFKTKGEMIVECKNLSLLKTLIGMSTSCSRYGRHGRTHCGRCVPCLVRAAAFRRAGMSDRTVYKFQNASVRRSDDADDVGAMAGACLRSHEPYFDSTIAGNFVFATPAERTGYMEVFKRGLREVEQYLHARSIL